MLQGETIDLESLLGEGSKIGDKEKDQDERSNVRQKRRFEEESGERPGKGLSQLIDLYIQRVDETLSSWTQKIVEVRCKAPLMHDVFARESFHAFTVFSCSLILRKSRMRAMKGNWN